MTTIYKTMRDAVEDMMFSKVLETKKRKIKKSETLRSFIKNKKFEEEYLDLFVDKVFIVFGCSIKKIKEKPLSEILDYLEKVKNNHSRYGQFKK